MICSMIMITLILLKMILNVMVRIIYTENQNHNRAENILKITPEIILKFIIIMILPMIFNIILSHFE